MKSKFHTAVNLLNLAIKHRNRTVSIPLTRFNLDFLNILERHGIVAYFTLTVGASSARYDFRSITVHFPHLGSRTPISMIEIPKYSSSFHRLSISVGDIGKFAKFMNTILILSTDRGLLTSIEARQQNLGGIPIAIVHF